jgi:hypothetical protein
MLLHFLMKVYLIQIFKSIGGGEGFVLLDVLFPGLGVGGSTITGGRGHLFRQYMAATLNDSNKVVFLPLIQRCICRLVSLWKESPLLHVFRFSKAVLAGIILLLTSFLILTISNNSLEIT